MEKETSEGIGTMRFVILFLISFQLNAKTCATDLKSFRALFGDENFPLLWNETTADDGKPLIVKISEENNKLFLQFVKTNEGLWAEGTADVCRDEDIVASISKDQIKLGKAAHWAIKMSMSGGAKFKLKLLRKDCLKISTVGWSGEFVPETLKH